MRVRARGPSARLMAALLPPGLTVVDLTVNVPGPLCSSILSDLGARVIKVEPPAGDPLRRSPGMWAGLNRGKLSIALDLKTPEGREALSRLAAGSDVVLEGWRPGVAGRLGADYATLSAANPDLVYCSISGFGQDGPWRDRPAHDIDFSALAGLLAAQAAISGRPWPPPVLASDVASGLYAAVAVLAALAGRGGGRGGRYIDLSMAESTLALLAPEVGRLGDGASGGGPNVTFIPHYGVFECADGRWFTLGIVDEDHFWQRFCAAAGLEHLADLKLADRVDRGGALAAEVRGAFLSRTSDHWSRALAEADVPGAAVEELRDLPDSPQFRHRGAFADTGEGTFLAQPFRVCGRMVGPERGAPGLGEHAGEILSELGYDPARAAELLRRGAPAGREAGT